MIKVEGLSVTFGSKKVVDNISFCVEKGKILGIVGESGSGKSMSMLAIAGLLPNTAKCEGRILLEEENGNTVELNMLSERERRRYNGEEISIIFQEPMTSLNPTMRVGRQIEEMLVCHEKRIASKRAVQRRQKVYEMLRMVDFDEPEKIYRMYPHSMSGGMRQRIMIAMALILNPTIMIADEPTTALDRETGEEIIKLIMRLNKEKNISIIFVSHDLGLIRRISDDVAVMKDGVIVERGNVFENPKNDYTKRLLGNFTEKQKEEACNGEDNDNIVEVKNLDLYYPDGKKRKYLKKGINFSIRRGEILGIQGRSGCGKTTLANAILGFHGWYDGEIVNKAVLPQMIFQDPYGSLNPVKTIEKILSEPLIVQKKYSREEISVRVQKAIEDVGLTKEHLKRYPKQLSGGQRQRVSIACAIIGGSNFIVADEPVSALDVTIQQQVLSLLLSLQKEYGLSILFISHDEAVMKQMCDRTINF